ncbi:MAG: endonuclease/exonuclease/phosphatase family protein [Paracoccaceae bacterium]
MRLATWNIEWFNALFDDEGRVLADDEPSARHRTSRGVQAHAIAAVLRAVDADGVLIVEGPDTGLRRSTVRALEGFAEWAGLRVTRAVHGYASDSEQEIGFLYDPSRLTVRHDPLGLAAGVEGAIGAPRFDTAYRYDLDADGVTEVIRFSKPPLELAVSAGGRELRLIGVHAKSKAPKGTRDPDEFRRISIENRRKQLAQCLWIRARAEAHLAAGDALIVLGDFNDGPGLDEYERLFGRSGVEIVRGVTGRLYDPHAEMALASRVGLSPTTARFWLAPQKRYFEALIDFIMVSPDLAGSDWRIWHPFNDPEVDAALQAALLSASDHFPVTIDVV